MFKFNKKDLIKIVDNEVKLGDIYVAQILEVCTGTGGFLMALLEHFLDPLEMALSTDGKCCIPLVENLLNDDWLKIPGLFQCVLHSLIISVNKLVECDAVFRCVQVSVKFQESFEEISKRQLAAMIL